ENTATAYAYGHQPADDFGPPSYSPQDQGYGGQDQGYQAPGYQAPGHGGQPGGPPQWRPGSGSRGPVQPRSQGQKGFFGSLLDFSFTSMVTPTIIRVLYVLAALMWTLTGLGYVSLAWATGGAGA